MYQPLLVGGGQEGKDASVRNAEAVYFGPTASISADAYPDEITDSPLIDAGADIVPSMFLGVIRIF